MKFIHNFTKIACSLFLSLSLVSNMQAQLTVTLSGNVGIGTTSPSAQLHNTGTVRFQGMSGIGPRLLQTGATGLLSALGAGTTGQVLTQTATGLAWTTPTTGSGWLLTGNTGNTTTHFLGTTDNTPIVVKTGNVERFQVRPKNYSTILVSDIPNAVGVWDTDPNVAVLGLGIEIQRAAISYGGSLGIHAVTSAAAGGTSATGTTMGQLAAVGNWHAGSALNGVAGYVTASRITQTSNATYTSGGGNFQMVLENATLSSPNTGHMVGGVVGALSGTIGNSQNTIVAALIGNDKINTAATWGAYIQGKTYVSGNVGIGTTAPTAVLHTVGTVRHQNLPNGTGRIVVADANGNLFLAQQTASVTGDNTEALKTIEKQNQEIKELKMRLERLENAITGQSRVNTEKVVLEQNVPNPTNGKTTINYAVPSTTKRAMLMIADLSGKQLQNLNLDINQTSIDVEMQNAGLFLYTLIVDGKVAESKKMLVEK